MPAPMQETNPGTTSQTGRVLIADDQQHILFALQILLSGSGYSTETVTHPTRVLRALESERFDAVLVDLNYTRDTVGGAEGLDLVSKIRSIDSVVPVLVMTAWSTVDLAVEAMRRGASDFVQKPWENRELLQKLQHQVALAREQRQRQRQREEELSDAREIQASLLPKQLPEVRGYEIAAVNQPLRFVGGDYYNVVRIDDRRTAVCIADVAGKGLPAALLMSTLQAALQPLIAQKLAPGELCQRLNRILCEVMPVGKFISFFYGVLDSVENRLTYCNAGHNPPLLVRADGASSELDAQGAVLGQFPEWQYRQSDLEMRGGDRMLLFTDGLVEANSTNEEQFGKDNVISVARENPQSSAHALMELLLRAASEHCDGYFQDDASLIVLKASGQD
ncbi:MAG TPA: SpoIIE family protein phosphatase [Candidatus Sulfotelmatobacter sp.]|nr:SpoIIE family protein phosphatase [Candidatus Sulfotelmatobacter sp.]